MSDTFLRVAVQPAGMFRREVAMDDQRRMKELRRRRVQGARLLESGVPPAEVARRVGVSRQSVMRWERAIEAGGIDRVKRLGPRGRPRRLSDAPLLELAQLLKKGSISAGYATEMWALPRIAALIQEKFAVRLAISSVWGLLGQMGWSVQRPIGQARQRDERAISTWKNKRWPELKKSQRDSDEPSSS
jgi:transposase